ncbi:hypothetical protein Lal_00011084 [Lupinus albus]|uniref:Putative response regulator and transcription factor RR-B-type family n=1 Tax=Lupinus albus TaxID=3870 RepID=A0A6A5P5T5_LUPAL|nr:putative response regulator and transcription factor RR-B-type family [Lupinus albus]KAF1892616.1 hypothetical protein Lal_00011084 [Lupinus albus]
MDNSCFPSPRRDVFPSGLRVLVVDDDPTWLKILQKMLNKCSYEVTTCCLARHALNLLRERKDGYDIVISDVNMPDMDGFKLLEHVGLEMDLPVIMMSVDGETSRVMKGVQHGACDYLLKPIRMKELRNIWQHVFRKRIHEAREFESFESFESIQLMRNGLIDQFDEGNLFALEDMTSTKKRKDTDNRDFGDSSSEKKARVLWSVELHQKFVKAVNQIGFDKVGPKKILDLMNVPWLTRENVASHLQKYRLYLSRLQKGNEHKSSSSGIKHSDMSSKDIASFGFHTQNSINMQQNDVAIDSYTYSDGALQQLQTTETKSDEADFKGLVSQFAMTENGRALSTDNNTVAKMRKSFLNQTLAPIESEGNHAVFDCTMPKQYSWREVPNIQLNEEHKSPLHSKKHHIQVHQSQPQSIASISSTPSITEGEVAACIETKPFCADYKSDYNSSSVSSIGSTEVDIFPIQPGSLITSEPLSATKLGFKTLGSNISSIYDMEFYQRNLVLGGSAPLKEDLHLSWQQGECYNMNFGFDLQNIGMCEYYDPELVTEVPTHLYDSADYLVIDQGLFIA